MGLKIQMVVDSKNPHELADWWAETLDWAVEPQDEAFIRSMISQGHATEEETLTHHGKLVWRTGQAIRPAEELDAKAPAHRVLFQAVPEPSRTASIGTAAWTAGTRMTSGNNWKPAGPPSSGPPTKARTDGTPWPIRKATSSASADPITRLVR